MRELQDLLDRVRAAKGPDRQIDAAFFAVAKGMPWRFIDRRIEFQYRSYHNFAHGQSIPELRWHNAFAPNVVGYAPVSRSIDAAVGLVGAILPSWWTSVCLCTVSGDCSMAPDYNGPDRERLLAEFPEDKWHEGIHADLRPGDGWHRACYAVLDCLLSALIEKAALSARSLEVE